MSRLIFLLVFLPVQLDAATYLVGAGYTYPNPYALYQANVLDDGDSILIVADTYVGQEALAVWQADDLTIVGIEGRPHLRADGQNIWGKGIWVLAGNNITVDNFEFSEAVVPDQNGAGIRLDGTGMVVRNCHFHDNETGILTSNPRSGDILIEYCEFDANGHGDGFSHNVYIGRVASLTFQFNYSHHAKIGHNLKSRAQNNYVLYNRIMDEDSGNSSRLVDLPNGGTSILIGNVLLQGPLAPNSNLIGYGLEGLSNATPHHLYLVNNTLINRRANSGLFLDYPVGTDAVVAKNNIYAGDGVITNSSLTSNQNNLNNADLGFFNFHDESKYDFRLNEESPAVNAGTGPGSLGDFNLTPSYEYVHIADGASRTIDQSLDVGAYEVPHDAMQPEIILESSSININGRPEDDLIILQGTLSEYTIHLLTAEEVLHTVISNTGTRLIIDMQTVPNEVRFLQIAHRTEPTLILQKFLAE